MGFRFAVLAFAAAAAWLACGEARAQAPQYRACAGTDWRALGYSDAEARGSPANAVSRIDEHRRACMDPMNVDTIAYEQGFEQGLRAFCTPQRAFRMARSGEFYQGWCPSDLAAGFADGYRDGMRVQTVETTLVEGRTAERHVREMRQDAQQRLDEARMSRAVSPIRGSGSPDGRAAADAADIAFMNQNSEMGDIQDNLDSVQQVLPQIEAQLEQLREELGDKYGEW